MHLNIPKTTGNGWLQKQCTFKLQNSKTCVIYIYNKYKLTKYYKRNRGRCPHAEHIPRGTVVLSGMMGTHARKGEISRSAFGPGLTAVHFVPGIVLHGRVGVAAAGQIDSKPFHDISFRTDEDPCVLWRVWKQI